MENAGALQKVLFADSVYGTTGAGVGSRVLGRLVEIVAWGYVVQINIGF